MWVGLQLSLVVLRMIMVSCISPTGIFSFLEIYSRSSPNAFPNTHSFLASFVGRTLLSLLPTPMYLFMFSLYDWVSFMFIYNICNACVPKDPCQPYMTVLICSVITTSTIIPLSSPPLSLPLPSLPLPLCSSSSSFSTLLTSIRFT